MFNENLGLDINKYNLSDLLALFEMPINFTKEHLIAAKRIVMKTHPDKSFLDKKLISSLVSSPLCIKSKLVNYICS